MLDNDNWKRFYEANRKNIRSSIVENVIKVIYCRTEKLGFKLYQCLSCNTDKKVFFSCKSRFCSSCGKKATDQWIKDRFNDLPNTKWQHITFTVPDLLWDLFWFNRKLLNCISTLAAHIIMKLAANKSSVPAIFAVLHTFGRDLKRNVHIHLSVTCIGIIVKTGKYVKLYFQAYKVKKMWRYEIINLFRKLYKTGNMKPPKNMGYIKTIADFNNFLNPLYNKDWYVNLQPPCDNPKKNVDYLARYLKRPPIGETRIKAYDGNNVTYEYLDHYDDTNKLETITVLEFIKRVITHIPDKYFRTIRYYGCLASKNKAKLLPLLYNAIGQIVKTLKKKKIRWRELISKTFNIDPLLCLKCNQEMVFARFKFANAPPNMQAHNNWLENS